MDDRLCHRGQRILDPLFSGSVHASVNILHEGVEMNAPLGLDIHRVKEQIHQHGFATPDPAPQIQTFRRCGGFAEQPAQQAALFGSVVFQPKPQILQLRQNRVLRGVSPKFALRHARFIDLGHVLPHTHYVAPQMRAE